MLSPVRSECRHVPTLWQLLTACALQILAENSLDRLRLFRIDDQVAVCILVIAEKAIRIDHDFALLKAVLDAQFHILTQGLLLLLGEGCHDGNHNFSAGIQGINVFLFKKDRNISGFQLSDVVETIHGISGVSKVMPIRSANGHRGTRMTAGICISIKTGKQKVLLKNPQNRMSV